MVNRLLWFIKKNYIYYRSAKVVLDVYLELNCKDSLPSWNTLRKVAAHYDPVDVSVVIHHFALPYHTNGFLLTQVIYMYQVYFYSDTNGQMIFFSAV